MHVSPESTPSEDEGRSEPCGADVAWSDPAAAFDHEGHELLRALHWRRRPDPRLQRVAWAAVLLLHVLLAWWLFVASRPYPVHFPEAPTQALIVRLISSDKPVPPPPAVELPPPLTAPPPSAHAPPRPAPPAARPAPPAAPTPSSTPSGTLHLYSPNGNLVLPKSVQSAPPVAAFAPRAPAGNVDMNPRQVVAPTQHTVFAQYWVPKNETLLDKAVRKTTQEITLPVHLPGNTRIKCAIVPLALGGGCGIVGPKQLSTFKAPKNATTIQFLPETPLVPGMGAPAHPSTSRPAQAASVPPPH